MIMNNATQTTASQPFASTPEEEDRLRFLLGQAGFNEDDRNTAVSLPDLGFSNLNDYGKYDMVRRGLMSREAPVPSDTLRYAIITGDYSEIEDIENDRLASRRGREGGRDEFLPPSLASLRQFLRPGVDPPPGRGWPGSDANERC